jgi:hypothetical protein
MRTNFVLIDSEKVKPEYIEELKHEHFRVIVSVGADSSRSSICLVRSLNGFSLVMRLFSV